MSKPAKPKTLDLSFERTIAAPPAAVFAAWLDPTVPGTPWSEHVKLIFQPKVDGMFYWLIGDNAHFGRFTEIVKGKRIQHTWMSKHTLGEESTVTLTFEPCAEGTTMTLRHTGLPPGEVGMRHEGGWNYFLDKLTKQLSTPKRTPARKRA